MKKVFFIWSIVLLFLVSCDEEFITLAPISEGNAENFYKTPDDFEVAIVAIYSNLSSKSQYGSNDTRYGGGFYAHMEVRADDVSDGEASSGVGKEVFEIDSFIDNPLSSVISSTFASIFKTIFDANVVITRIENISIENAQKNKLIAEARFLRALAYFNAVRLWGDVPIILKEITPQDAYTLSRNSVENVYARIEKDFLFAIQNLPSKVTGQEGRATSGAAQAFLGKVYLTQKKWAEATSTLSEIINQYELLTNVEDVFSLESESNNEIIFAVKFKSGNDDLGHLGFGTPEFPTLVSLYDTNDTRLPLVSLISGTNGTYPKKQFEQGDGQLGRDFPVLRYADVLLMYAEALNEIGYQSDGTAFELLNKIRTRANVSKYTSSDLLDQQSFRKAVLLERRLELPFELHRWFDLIRTDNALQSLSNVGVSIQSYQLLYPIPQEEINIYNNKLKFPQNPGY